MLQLSSAFQSYAQTWLFGSPAQLSEPEPTSCAGNAGSVQYRLDIQIISAWFHVFYESREKPNHSLHLTIKRVFLFSKASFWCRQAHHSAIENYSKKWRRYILAMLDISRAHNFLLPKVAPCCGILYLKSAAFCD